MYLFALSWKTNIWNIQNTYSKSLKIEGKHEATIKFQFWLTMFTFCSSTTALIQKLAKECEDANHVVKKVEEVELAQGSKRTYSAGDSVSAGSLYKGSR